MTRRSREQKRKSTEGKRRLDSGRFLDRNNGAVIVSFQLAVEHKSEIGSIPRHGSAFFRFVVTHRGSIICVCLDMFTTDG